MSPTNVFTLTILGAISLLLLAGIPGCPGLRPGDPVYVCYEGAPCTAGRLVSRSARDRPYERTWAVALDDGRRISAHEETIYLDTTKENP